MGNRGERDIVRLVLAIALIGVGAPAPALAQIADYASFVFIECQSPDQSRKSRGSGVVVGADGRVLTAKHVAPEGWICRGARGSSTFDPNRLLSRFGESQNHDAVILKFEQEADEEFLQVGYTSLGAGSQTWKILAYGVPVGGVGAVSVREGIISTTIPDANGWIETDVLTARGMSGGPVVVSEAGSAQGALVGIVAGSEFDPATGAPTNYPVLAAQEIAAELDLPRYLLSDPPTNAGDRIGESYLRLVGASQVSVLLDLLERGGFRNDPADQPDIAVNSCNLRANEAWEGGGHIDCSLFDFWAGSPFRDAKPLLNAPLRRFRQSVFNSWRLISESGDHAPDFLFCANYSHRPYMPGISLRRGEFYLTNELLREVFGPDVPSEATGPLRLIPRTLATPSGSHSFPDLEAAEDVEDDYEAFDRLLGAASVPPPEAEATLKRLCTKLSRNVGFLFLAVENRTGQSLRDVRLTYAVAPNADPGDEFWTTLDSNGDELLDDAAAVRFEKRILRAPDMQPAAQYLWLMSVYAAAEDNFERKQLYDLELPISITYRIGGVDQTERLRLPRRRSVAPIAMPLGWYAQ